MSNLLKELFGLVCVTIGMLAISFVFMFLWNFGIAHNSNWPLIKYSLAVRFNCLFWMTLKAHNFLDLIWTEMEEMDL